MSTEVKDQALQQIRELTHRHNISLEEIAQAIQGDREAPSARSSLLIKALSYIGGTLIFAGIAVFIGMQWDGINSASRVILTLGPGISFFVMAIAAYRDHRYQSLSVPLFLAAALLEPTGMMVGFVEFGSGSDADVAGLITALTCALQFGALFWRWKLTLLAGVTLFFLSWVWGLLLEIMDASGTAIAMTLGIAWLATACRTIRSAMDVLSTPLFVLGGGATLAALFDVVEGSAFEIVFLVAACATIYLGVWVRSRTLNFVGAMAILSYTTYFTGRYFADSIGWPVALILIGLLILGIGALALKIDRNYLREHH